MPNNFHIQVTKDHYYNSQYDDLKRFISYYYQIDLIRDFYNKKILEIGIGNKTVLSYLKKHKFKIDSCDFDKELEPDYVGDIRSLPFSNDAYDLIMACEVLEHIPWDDVNQALNELYRVSKKYVLISIPYFSIGFEIILKFPFIKKIFSKPFFNLFIRITGFFKPLIFSGEHYWEMGRKGYPARKIKSTLQKKFKIIKEVRPILNHYHHFFLLEKHQ